ncbi:MAG TPA: hypothetical protein VF461_18185 [Gemmatimonadaceae bacterium]
MTALAALARDDMARAALARDDMARASLARDDDARGSVMVMGITNREPECGVKRE